MRFWQGFALALVVVAALAMAAIGWVLVPSFVQLVRDFEAVLPWPFALVSTPAWSAGWALGLPAAALVVLRRVRDPKWSVLGLVGLAIVGAAVVAFTLVALYGPLYEPTARIQ